MGYIRGKPLEPGEKRAIVSVKGYFDRNRKDWGVNESSAQLTADALEISISTVKRVMAEYRRDPSSLEKAPEAKGRPSYAIDQSHEEALRGLIRQANQQGQYITLATISEFIQARASELSFHPATLARTLDRWGFEFGQGKRSQHLKEKDDIVALRRRYLRRMRENRNTAGQPIRPEIYLDESYVNRNHSNDFIWYSDEDGPWVQKPTGKGERLIIVHAMSERGWIEPAKLVFAAKRKTGDYHGQMNADLFQKWFSERLLPHLPANSLIIMDNASYHNTLSASSAPTPTCAKERIWTWLLANHIPCSKDCLKAELVDILKKVAPSPTYEVDEMAQKNGHEIIRTPPYHPELQPIETCWGVVKNHIARHCDFTLANLQSQLEEGFTIVTGPTCSKIIKKIKAKEDQFWEEDLQLDPSD